MNMRTSRVVKAASLLATLGLIAWLAHTLTADACPAWTARHVQLGTQRFTVEVAATMAERNRGLSGRASLDGGTGMLFVFPKPDLHGFWMKDMHFPIDLVWIGPDRTVLGLSHLAPCERDPCPIYSPPSPVAYVLEVNSGSFIGKTGDSMAWDCAP